MQLYCVLRGRNHEEIVIRLVHYYASFEPGIRDEPITSGAVFHLHVAPADYCRKNATDFDIQQVFDEDPVAKAQGVIPCFLLHE